MLPLKVVSNTHSHPRIFYWVANANRPSYQSNILFLEYLPIYGISNSIRYELFLERLKRNNELCKIALVWMPFKAHDSFDFYVPRCKVKREINASNINDAWSIDRPLLSNYLHIELGQLSLKAFGNNLVASVRVDF